MALSLCCAVLHAQCGPCTSLCLQDNLSKPMVPGELHSISHLVSVVRKPRLLFLFFSKSAVAVTSPLKIILLSENKAQTVLMCILQCLLFQCTGFQNRGVTAEEIKHFGTRVSYSSWRVTRISLV